MKKKQLPILLLISLFVLSCGPKKSDYEALKSENDSLKNIKTELENEVNDYFSIMNQIQESINQIKSAENTISVQSSTQEFDEDAKTKMKEDVQYITDVLKNSKEELDNLKSRLKSSSLKLGELENTVKVLTQSLEEETQKVTQLQKLLADKETQLQTLGSTVQLMEKEIQDLASVNEEKNQKLTEQDISYYSAWYVFGTRKELKEQNILTPGGLFSSAKVLENENFNKDYFVRIDSREVREIEFFSKKAKILTTHPESSYSLEKIDGQYVLNIDNPTLFWSISKYLVVDVD